MNIKKNNKTVTKYINYVFCDCFGTFSEMIAGPGQVEQIKLSVYLFLPKVFLYISCYFPIYIEQLLY